MAAYGVIGGFIGGAIALAITPMLMKQARKQYNKKEHKEPETYRPGAALFFFLIFAIGDVGLAFLYIYWALSHEFNIIYTAVYALILIIGMIFGCWTGSFLRGRITISKEQLEVDHAVKMSNKDQHEVKVMQLGLHHLELRWEDIRELRANRNFMKIILHNDECYMFPIGWCKEDARFAVERHKKIKPWE